MLHTLLFFLNSSTYTPEVVGRTIANSEKRVFDDHIMFVLQTPENASETKKKSIIIATRKKRERER